MHMRMQNEKQNVQEISPSPMNSSTYRNKGTNKNKNVYEKLEKEYMNLKLELAQLEANRDEHSLQLKKSTKVKETLEKQLKASEKEIADYKSQHEKLQKDKDDLEIKMNNLEINVIPELEKILQDEIATRDFVKEQVKPVFDEYNRLKAEGDKYLNEIQQRHNYVASDEEMDVQQQIETKEGNIKKLEEQILQIEKQQQEQEKILADTAGMNNDDCQSQSTAVTAPSVGGRSLTNMLVNKLSPFRGAGVASSSNHSRTLSEDEP